MNSHNNKDFPRVSMEQWRISMREEAREEWKLNSTKPSALLRRELRGILWYSCAYLDVLEYGVPGYACRLIEFYLTEKYRLFVADNPDESSWAPYKAYLVKNYPVIMAGAIIISSKLHHARPVNARTASDRLIYDGFVDCTIENINNAELDIMVIHDFRLRIWSNVHVAEVLAYYVGLPVSIAIFTRVLVNCSEFLYYKLNEDMNSMFYANILGGCRILSLHLAAAAVYATSKYFTYNMRITLDQLTVLADAPELYLTYLADLILKYTRLEGMI